MGWTFCGAGRENRTPISSLENSHTNRCTIPARSTYHYTDFFVSVILCYNSQCAPVAQWIEQKTSKLMVVGSIPTRGTIIPDIESGRAWPDYIRQI